MVNAAPRAERLGRYLVFEPFAEGGMARVCLGRLIGDAGFTRLVAIKRPHERFAQEAASDVMMLDEARLASRIRHPNVVETLDVARVGNELLLVMEYVHGVSLAGLRNAAEVEKREIPVDVLSAIFVGVLRGLHAAHEARAADGSPLGIVHRDVSLRNVIVGSDGNSRVLDFGVAKALRKDYLSISGEIKGTIAYMSPEQVRSSGVTRQSDLFMVGAVMWEMLTGQRPFAGDDPASVITAILGSSPPAPSTIAGRARVSPALDAVVQKALAPEPRNRFATAEEMAIALADACPPASAEDVARFVEYVAMDELEERAARVRAVESAPIDTDPTPPAAAPIAPDPSARSVSIASSRRTTAPVRRALVVAGVVAIAVFVFALARRPAPAVAATQESAPPPSAASTAALDPAPRAVDPEPAPSPSPAPSVDLDEVEGPGPATHAGAPHRARPAARRSADPAGCDPPYSIDESGKKHYKLKCLP